MQFAGRYNQTSLNEID